MNIFMHLNYQSVFRIICTILLICISFSSKSAVSDLADIPLTEATPESQNISSARLNEAVKKITNGDYGDINSLLVIRNNYLVLEKYFSSQYYGQEYKHPILSATKSITSALIGIAIKQGKIKDVQKYLLEFFPEYKDLENLGSRKKEITLENILTMTAGFQWDELSASYGHPENDSFNMTKSPDWIQHVLDLPMIHSPGSSMTYNSGCSILLSGILQNSTEQSAEAFATDFLFKPLGIKEWSWSIVPNEISNTAWGLSMRRLDMARFGILFLNDGRWLDNQVISRNWQEISTKMHVNGKTDGILSKYAYGYQWWRFTDSDITVSNLAVNDIYFAWGYGGQFIFVIPHLGMVVVSTGGNYGADHRLFFDVLRDHIFPAVMD